MKEEDIKTAIAIQDLLKSKRKTLEYIEDKDTNIAVILRRNNSSRPIDSADMTIALREAVKAMLAAQFSREIKELLEKLDEL